MAAFRKAAVMKILFIGFAGLGLLASGCAKSDSARQDAGVERGTFTVAEADSLLCQDLELLAKADAPLAEAAPAAPAVPEAQELPDKKTAQEALKILGFYKGAIDAKFGPKTQAAIQDFQRAHGLVIDGKCGPKTWGVLKTALAQTGTVEESESKKVP